jgi:hypothetical protein
VGKYPEHDEKCFYKYTEMHTAKMILQTGNFRYSSPVTFNDPFDIQTELLFDFDLSHLPERVTEEVDAIVTGRKQISLSGDSNWVKAIELLKQKHGEGKYRREHLNFVVKPLIEFLTSIIEDTRSQYNGHWRTMLNQIKVFCVTEHNDNILMWSHYAKYHTGVCFKLKVLPKKDNPICVAKKVRYYPNPPIFFGLEEWVESIVLDQDVDISKLNSEYPITKADIWSYEDEWRVWAPFDENGKDYLDMPIIDGEIEAVYFGIKADQNEKETLVSLAKKRGVSEFYQAYKKPDGYRIEYEKI